MGEREDKMTVTEFWDHSYTESGVNHHSPQNEAISSAFINLAKESNPFNATLKDSKFVLELGCGTGQLTHFLKKEFNIEKVIGTDISSKSIELAKETFPDNQFEVFDFLNDKFDKYPDCDTFVCSNVFEHFQEPFAAIGPLLKHCKHFIILVPFEETLHDKWFAEGHGNHVYSFSIKSFEHCNVEHWATFSSAGWPMQQLAIILKGELQDSINS
jgi:SAM-dependent methyltransferase